MPGPVPLYKTIEDYKNDPAMQALARALAPTMPGSSTSAPDIVTWAEQNYWVMDEDMGIALPIRLMPHQKSLLRFMFAFKVNWRLMVWSCPKKSGKTAIAGLVARFVAEHFGPRNEILCMANDLEQSIGRVYKAVQASVELNPDYDREKHLLFNNTGEQLWHSLSRVMEYVPGGTTIKAIASDYKGEAGANPTLTLWTELWGYVSEASRRFWSELTPVPTRKRSFRFVETYAGYEDESDILLDVYRIAVKEGRRVTRSELEPYGGWPYDDDVPLYINEEAGAVAYWDDGPLARRMPWQTPPYYASEAKVLTEEQFNHLHNNYWQASVSAFLDEQWWIRQGVGQQLALGTMPRNEPCVLGADASVTSDCTALVLVTRHPDRHQDVAQRYVEVWHPSPEHPMDYTLTIEARIRELCAKYNVVQLAYDPYQLHKMGTDLTREAVVWAKPFNQGTDREKADYQLYTLIRDKRIEHISDPTMGEHIRNAGKHQAKDEDTKLRIVKKPKGGHIDAVVATSMAAYECLRLNL